MKLGLQTQLSYGVVEVIELRFGKQFQVDLQTGILDPIHPVVKGLCNRVCRAWHTANINPCEVALRPASNDTVDCVVRIPTPVASSAAASLMAIPNQHFPARFIYVRPRGHSVWRRRRGCRHGAVAVVGRPNAQHSQRVLLGSFYPLGR